MRSIFRCLVLVTAATTVLPAALAAPPFPLPAAVDRDVDYAEDVHPILEQHCVKCHGRGSDKGDFQIDSRELLLEGGSSGAAVIEGNSADSLLIELVAEPDPDFAMPPEGQRLSENEIGILRAWIDRGLEWSLDAAEHYSPATPLHLQPVDVPVGGIADSTHPIDHLIAAHRTTHDLPPPEMVDDALFIRRAYLDSIGLLPRPAAVAAFAASDDVLKYDRLIRDLLARDRDYAEHWMTFWNDHLRNDYEGTGYIDNGRKPITGWLYRALLSNEPYDEFVENLIDPVTGASEGFIKGIVWRGDNAAIQKPTMQAARNVAQVFMGVNLKCASCHDSFIDHWKLEDAYGLANAFSEEPMELVRCDTPMGQQADYKFLWPELGKIDGSRERDERAAQVAELVTKPENGYFARTIVNRIWAKLMGRGLIEPLDAIERAAWHPELLDWLAHDFIDNGYDLKRLMLRICTSDAYRQVAVDEPIDPKAQYVFRGPRVRRMTAEMFYDALSQLTGVWQPEAKFRLPRMSEEESNAAIRAWRTTADPLSRALGRPNREQIVTRRESAASTLQALELSNGGRLTQFLRDGAAKLAADGPADPDALAIALFEQALQRAPTDDERMVVANTIGEPVAQEGIEDALWTLAMLPEFQLIR